MGNPNPAQQFIQLVGRLSNVNPSTFFGNWNNSANGQKGSASDGNTNKPLNEKLASQLSRSTGNIAYSSGNTSSTQQNNTIRSSNNAMKNLNRAINATSRAVQEFIDLPVDEPEKQD